MTEPPIDPRTGMVEFEPVRVGGRRRRGWSPLLVGGWLLAVGSVVAAGTLGRPGPDPAPSLTAIGTAEATATSPQRPPPAALIRRDAPNPLAVEIAPGQRAITVTGTRLPQTAVWVFLSVQDARGDVLTWQSLSTGDPDDPLRPTQRPAFEVSLHLGRVAPAGALVLEVNAYNDLGRKVASLRQGFRAESVQGVIALTVLPAR